VQRRWRLVDLPLARELHEERTRLLENFRAELRVLEHQLDLLELAAVAERLLQRRVDRVGVRHLADQDLDRASPHARCHPHAHRVPVPAVWGSAELIEEVLSQGPLLLALPAR